MRFRQRLVFGHLALLAVTIITGATAIIALRVSTGRLDAVTRELTADILAIERLRYEAEQVVATSRAYLLTGDETERKEFEQAADAVEDSLARLDARRGDLEAQIATVQMTARAYVAAAEQAARERNASGDPRDIVPFFERTLDPSHQSFEAALSAFVRREQAAFEQNSAKARALAARSQAIVIATTALGILLAIALAWLSIRRLHAHYGRERAATAAAKRAVASRDELLAIVSHDLRNPLQTISLGTGLLHQQDLSPRVRKHVSAIGNASVRMEHLIQQLLDLAKLDRGKLELSCERCEVSSLADAAVSMFQPRALDARVALTSTIDPAAGTVLADRERILQVLSNLIGNALKFTPADGAIELTARSENGEVRFEIHDTGPGIAPDQLANVFDRYFQGESRGRGSLGLGLYICKQIVTAHGGDIGVTSEPGKGSTFWFTLPR